MGKTQLIIAERLALATGRPLLGETTKRCKVWYYNGEDPGDELDRRFLATCLHYGINARDIEGWLFVDSGRDMPIVIAREERAGLVIAYPVVEGVIAAIKENGIDVFTVDPFVSSHEVSENDNAKINAVARQWAAIAEQCNCAVELVHHVRKTGGAEITVEDARGASALHDAARSMRALNRMSEDEAKKAGIDNPRLYFRTDDAGNKISMKPPASGATWFKLASVGLGNQRADRPEDNVGVATRWEWPDAHAGLPAGVEQIVQAAVNSGKWRAHPQAKQWVGKRLAEPLGLDAEEKHDKERLKTIIADYIERGILETFTAPDENSDPREFVRVKKQPS
jgi:hypothetical protein